jgi:hypothetical protein
MPNAANHVNQEYNQDEGGTGFRVGATRRAKKWALGQRKNAMPE